MHFGDPTVSEHIRTRVATKRLYLQELLVHETVLVQPFLMKVQMIDAVAGVQRTGLVPNTILRHHC